MGKRGEMGRMRSVQKRAQRKSLSIRGVVWIRYGVAIIKRDKQNV